MGLKEELQKPFSVKDLEFRVGSTSKDKTKGIALVYITARAVMGRFDEVFGVENWDVSFRELNKGGLICRIEALTKDNTTTYKEDVSEFSDIESIKGGASGAFKRAAVHFGIGRYLYDIPNKWVELKDGKYFKNNDMELCNLVLPDWAILPNELASVRGNKVSEVKKEEPPKTETPANPVNIEEAYNVVCTTGYSKGKKMGDLTETQLNYLVQKGTDTEKAAAKLVLDSK